MEDFIAAHTRPGAPPPVVSTAPSWMSDFAEPAPREEQAPPARPDWMKDFDS
jgi:hypothetical protein